MNIGLLRLWILFRVTAVYLKIYIYKFYKPLNTHLMEVGSPLYKYIKNSLKTSDNGRRTMGGWGFWHKQVDDHDEEGDAAASRGHNKTTTEKGALKATEWNKSTTSFS